MRGTEAIEQLINSKALLASDPERSLDLMALADHEAQRQGQQDFRDGIDEPPAAFLQEPALLSAWNQGFDFSCSLAEMANCAGCNNSEYTWNGVCPDHG